METGRLIKDLRIKKGMTQEELADKTEVSSRTIQRIENGDVDPRAYTLQMIAKALEVDFSLFTENESKDHQEIEKIDNNNWLGILHLSGLLPLFFPTILVWNNRKEKSKEISNHFRAVISLQLCILGICIGGLWVYWNSSILTPFIGGLIVGGLLSIFNAIKVMDGKPYINPFIKNRQSNSEKAIKAK